MDVLRCFTTVAHRRLGWRGFFHADHVKGYPTQMESRLMRSQNKAYMDAKTHLITTVTRPLSLPEKNTIPTLMDVIIEPIFRRKQHSQVVSLGLGIGRSFF